MSDLIDRQAAIDAVRSYYDECDESDKSIEERIEALPPAQPERKTGKWVRNFDGNEWHWFCSNCKEKWYEEDLWMGGNGFPNYCPNCGADMRGNDNG